MNEKYLFLVAVAVQQSHGGALYQALRVSRVGRKRTVEGRGRGKRFNFELFVLTSAGTAREPAAAAASLVETQYMLRQDISNQCATSLQSPESLCRISTNCQHTRNWN